MTTIPHLHPHKAKDGTTHWHWKPSPRLRKAGYVNHKLGTDRKAAILQAIDLNEAVAQFDAAGGRHLEQAPRPRRYTFTDLVDAYKQSGDYTQLAKASRNEYDVRLRQLTVWTQDGTLPLAAIDATMVRDLRDGMVQGGASAFKVGSLLRVLKLLFNWAAADGREIMESNPAGKVKIREAPSRSVIIHPAHVDQAAAMAATMGWAPVGLAITMALWTLQRQADLLALTRMNWREMDNCAAEDRRTLAGDDGKVMGFRIRQRKTGAWVDCPLPPHLHAGVKAAFESSQWLLADATNPERAMPAHILQRRTRQVLAACDMGHAQFRDLRRSGMCMFRDMGAEDSGITCISGHMVLGKRSILDTYMPKNTRTACATMATVERSRQHALQMQLQHKDTGE